MTTYESLKKIVSKPKVDVEALARYFDKYADKYGVSNVERKRAFWAQFIQETDGLRSLVEYASGKAYEGRKDLGNTQPGDGVRFKGRGGFMTTGRYNYQAASRHIFKDDRLLTQPELLEQPENAVISSLFYWKSRGLNELADKGDFETITKRINGGLNGWADRLSYWEKAKLFFSIAPRPIG